jgi:hypothetical protein
MGDCWSDRKFWEERRTTLYSNAGEPFLKEDKSRGKNETVPPIGVRKNNDIYIWLKTVYTNYAL